MTNAEFNEKVVVCGPKVFRFAARLTGSEATAQDIMQDVMERMWRRRLVLYRTQNIEALMMRTARNRCYDLMRHRKVVEASHPHIAAESATTTEQTLAPMERSEIQRIVTGCISHLPEKQRCAIHLRDIEGYEFDEISLIMDCDTPSVRVYLSRARKTIKEQLKSYMES